MERTAIVVSLFAGTWLLARLLMPRAIAIGAMLGIVNKPSARGVTHRPVPRTGGVPLCLAFVAGVAASFSLPVDRFPAETERVALLIAGSIFIAVTMFYDDALGLAPLPKLAIQIAAAAIVVLPRLRGELHGIAIEQINVPFYGEARFAVAVSVALTILWFVGMMNTVNWMDGVDGLASSVTLVACGILFLHTFFWPRGDPQFTISILPAVLAAAVAGFLQFNWHPSKLMMGDAGANFLGFALAAISIIGGAKMATALLVLGLPLLDVGWVILSRLLDGSSPLAADRRHLHHRLLDRGWSHGRVVAFITGASFAFGVLALVLPTRELKLIAIGGVGVLLLATVRRYDHSGGTNPSRRHAIDQVP